MKRLVSEKSKELILVLASIYAKKPDVNLGSIFLQVIEEVGQDIGSVPDDEILKVLRKIKDQDGHSLAAANH